MTFACSTLCVFIAVSEKIYSSIQFYVHWCASTAMSVLLAKASVQLWDPSVNHNLFFFVDIKQTLTPRGTRDSTFPHIKRYLYKNIQQGYADFTQI